MNQIFYRKCETCGRGMNTGYIYADGTYCSMPCLPITEAEWNEQYDDDGDNYYTEWEEPNDEYSDVYDADGNVINGGN